LQVVFEKKVKINLQMRMILIIIYIGLKKWFDMLPTNAIATASFILTVDSDKTFQVFPPGEFRAGDGRPKNVKAWWFGDKLLDYLKSLQNDVVIDYEHQSLNTVENGKEAPAAGWVSEFLSNEKGLFGINAKWTERAQTMLKQDEYRYISPVFTYDLKSGEILKLHSIGLTNTPAIDGMQPVALTLFQKQGISMYREILGLPPDATDEDVTSSITALKNQKTTQSQSKELLTLLGLKEGSTEPEVINAVAILKKKSESKSDNVDPSLYVPVAVLSAVQNDYAELRRELSAIQQANTLARKEELIAANRDKLTNEESAAWARTLTLESLTDYLKHIPTLTALKNSQTQGSKPPDSKTSSVELSFEEKVICSQLGITEEDFVKARGDVK
jgi:phage I-like protein